MVTAVSQGKPKRTFGSHEAKFKKPPKKGGILGLTTAIQSNRYHRGWRHFDCARQSKSYFFRSLRLGFATQALQQMFQFLLRIETELDFAFLDVAGDADACAKVATEVQFQ